MRFFARFVSVAALMLAFGCGGGDGGSESSPDCRNIGCVGDFSCQINADGAYQCLPRGEGGAAGQDGDSGNGVGSQSVGGGESIVDCRNDGRGCTAPFECRRNDNGDYECLESEVNGGSEGGVAGQGGGTGNETGSQGIDGGEPGNEAGGASGQGGDSGNEAGSAGEGGGVGLGGTPGGSAGEGSSAGLDGSEGGSAGEAGAGGDEAGATGQGGDGFESECSRQTLETVLTDQLETVTTDTDFSVYLGRPDGASYVYNRGASTLDTVYESASTSKLVTAVLILWVLERSTDFSLQNRPQDILDFWRVDEGGAVQDITLHHLLSFTSGLTAEPSCVKFGIPRHYSLNECVEAILQDNLLMVSNPGASFHYGPTHLHVAGAMAVAAGGFSSWSALFESFQNETGLLQNARYDLPSANNPRLAAGMHWTGIEYVEFLAAVLRYDVISEDSLERLMASQTSGLPTSYSPTESRGYPWQYGYGVWIECPQTGPCARADYRSSPGAYGAYPFFKSDGSYWGLVARQGALGTFPEGVAIGELIRAQSETWSTCSNP